MTNKLFNYYKKKYKLNIKLRYYHIKDGLGTYNLENKTITIDKNQIKDFKYGDIFIFGSDIGIINNFQEAIIFALLHEIKHAIDFKDKKGYNVLNTNDYDLRANIWAKKEFKKWKKNY